MNDFFFLFDLNTTIIKSDVLNVIAESAGICDQFNDLYEKLESNKLSFKDYLNAKYRLIGENYSDSVEHDFEKAEISSEIVEFIRAHKERCIILSDIPDIWLHRLLNLLMLSDVTICSHAVEDSYSRVQKLISIIDERIYASQMVQPFIAVGSDPYGIIMAPNATIRLCYTGINAASTKVLEKATHLIHNEHKLVEFMEKLI